MSSKKLPLGFPRRGRRDVGIFKNLYPVLSKKCSGNGDLLSRYYPERFVLKFFF
jgi:hypothetical protein